MRAAPVLMLLLAGCFGGNGGDEGGDNGGDDPDDGTAPPPPPPPPTGPPAAIDLLLSFDLSGCRGITVMQDQDIADVQDLLPDGFTAAVNPVTGGPNGVLAIDLFFCGLFSTPSSEVNETWYGQTYTFVEPPTDVWPSAPTEGAQEYVFRVLGGPDVLPLLWAVAGYDVRNGSASARLDSVGAQGLGVRSDTITMGDYNGMATTAALLATAAPIPVVEPFTRYSIVEQDGSLLVWTGTYAFPAAIAGTGTFDVPDDDPFADHRLPTEQLGGFSLTYPEGGMEDMDLRRYWPPFT